MPQHTMQIHNVKKVAVETRTEINGEGVPYEVHKIMIWTAEDHPEFHRTEVTLFGIHGDLIRFERSKDKEGATW